MNDQILQDTQSILSTLISFDTTSHQSNMEMINWIENYLAKIGIVSTIIRDDSMDKANLYATIGPMDKPGIMLSGHSDVVPVEGQKWTSNPFKMENRDQKLFGRGSCDMKGFIAACLAYAPHFYTADLKTPIHMAFTYDEEVTCAGAHTLIEALNHFPIKPAMCIVGEPTGMQVVTGQKSGFALKATVTGLEVHSSLAPHGVNAIDYACELIVYLRNMANDFKQNGPFGEGYDVNFNTVQTGTIKGGSALNIVPRDCIFEFEFRLLPDYNVQALRDNIDQYIKRELVPKMKAIHKDAGFQIEETLYMPGFELDPGDDVIAFVRSLAGRNNDIKVAYQTEAGLFAQNAGIPSVIIGPGHISQAHKPDEFVSLEQMSLCCQFLTRLLDRTRLG
jgi:acetylornithine deacetylase